MSLRVDLNADLGESFGRWRLGDDEAMLDVVTSANVACGFHAGDPLTLQRTCAMAAARGVVVGAQVGYRDLAGFGRRAIEMPSDELTAEVLYQLGALDAMCRAAGTRVAYVKPHGALYNTIVTDERQATAVVNAIARYEDSLPLVCLPDSVAHQVAQSAGLPVVREAFADRAYTAAGGLVPRNMPGAVLSDPTVISARTVALVTQGVVPAIDGTAIAVQADSICVHGDSPGAVAIATVVRAALTAADVTIAPFQPFQPFRSFTPVTPSAPLAT